MILFPYHNVVITGGAGFVGSVVASNLRALGIEPFIVRSHEYDLRYADRVQSLLNATRPELVIHIAANCGGIGYNQKNPAMLFYDNAMMGLNLIEQCHQAGIQKVVLVGTVCAYPRNTPAPFKEDDLWNGYPEETNAPYGLAKKMLLVQSQAYRQQYGFNSIYLVPVNLYGPGDSFDPQNSHVIPALIRKCVEAKREGKDFIEVWGSGSASREFLHVDDCANAIVRAAALYNDGDPVNIGTGQEITIKNLVSTIADITGFTGEVCWQTDKPDGQPRRCLDTSRARERFGFTATTSLEDGLRKTIEWYEGQGV